MEGARAVKNFYLGRESCKFTVSSSFSGPGNKDSHTVDYSTVVEGLSYMVASSVSRSL